MRQVYYHVNYLKKNLRLLHCYPHQNETLELYVLVKKGSTDISFLHVLIKSSIGMININDSFLNSICKSPFNNIFFKPNI